MRILGLMLREVGARRLALLDGLLGGAVAALGAAIALWLLLALMLGSLRLLSLLAGMG